MEHHTSDTSGLNAKPSDFAEDFPLDEVVRSACLGAIFALAVALLALGILTVPPSVALASPASVDALFSESFSKSEALVAPPKPSTDSAFSADLTGEIASILEVNP